MCIKHNVESKLYFYDSAEHNHRLSCKLYLNYKEGDYIENGPQFWTICKWDNKMERNRITRYKQRLNVTHSFLMTLHQHICFQSMFIYVLICC